LNFPFWQEKHFPLFGGRNVLKPGFENSRLAGEDKIIRHVF
jgi:hypothetical protein